MQPHPASNNSPSELEAALRAALERLGRPVPIATLQDALPAALQLPPQALRRALDALVANGELYAAGTARTRCYSTRDFNEYGTRAVLGALGERPRSKAELTNLVKAEAPWLTKLDPLLTQLVAAGKIFAHPQLRQGLPTKAIAKYGREPAPPPAPEAFLADTLKALEKARRKAEPHGVTIRALLEELQRRTERQLPDASPLRAASATDVQRTLAALQALHAREPSAGLFPIRQLRAQLDLGKGQFDDAVLALSRDGLAILHHHDFPDSLSDSEREKLVVDAEGTHFVGIALGVSS